MEISPIINHKKCNLCRKCIDVCPKDILTINDGKVDIVKSDCILCSHCYTVCRHKAVEFKGSLRNIAIESFKYSENVYPPGKFEPETLVNFIRSRRSIRRFKDKPVIDLILKDLVEFAVTVPSGSNTQNWEFTVINSREKVYDLALEIGNFFIKVNTLVRNPFIRYLSFFWKGMKLINYYKTKYATVERKLKEVEKGKDPLFYGATALIILHSSADGNFYIEDAQYSSYNITLLAHAIGLGTCYIGYASEVLNLAKKIKTGIGIPETHRVNAVLAIGYPDVSFHNLAMRKPYKSRWI